MPRTCSQRNRSDKEIAHVACRCFAYLSLLYTVFGRKHQNSNVFTRLLYRYRARVRTEYCATWVEQFCQNKWKCLQALHYMITICFTCYNLSRAAELFEKKNNASVSIILNYILLKMLNWIMVCRDIFFNIIHNIFIQKKI